MNMPTNMGASDTVVSQWRPQSPFADNYVEGEGPLADRAISPSATFINESPFVNEVEMTSELSPVDPASEVAAEVLGELHDPELDEVLYELVHEASALSRGQLAGELGDKSGQEARVERMLDEHFAPLARQTEEMLERMAEALAPLDPMAMSERELDEVLDRVEVPGRMPPTFELFVKKMKKKGKKAVKGTVKAAKKGRAKAAPGGILKKLGALVKPLLKKVLTIALDKIPPKYKPLAIKLAERIGLRKPPVAKPLPPPPADDSASPADAQDASSEPAQDASSEPAQDTSSADAPESAAPPEDSADTGPLTEDADATESAATSAADTGVTAAPPEESAADITQAQSDMDVQIAELVLSDNEEEQEATVARAVVRRRARSPLSEIERARASFVRRVRALRPGESPAPAVEEFIPAILTAVRLGIKIIGRPRVVKFLGGLIGKLIQPLAGKDLAPGLGQAIADIGLKALLRAEVTSEETREAASRAIATTVEDTVRRVSALPEHVFENTALLEAHALEAFETAAAASFPPALVRPDLREAAGVNATWVSLPSRGRAYYRKFSKVFDADITPQMAATIRTFGGQSLLAFLRDRLRISPEGGVRAKVHLYQLLPGGRLCHIAEHEQVRGLGDGKAWRQLHPLSPHAATALLSHPRLGTPFGAAPDPLRPGVGQRFYFLEIDRAPAKPVGKVSCFEVTADFPRDEIRVHAFIGEAAAQEIAATLRKGGSAGAAIHKLRTLFRAEMGVLAREDNERLLRFVKEKASPSSPADTLVKTALRATRRMLRKQLGIKIIDWFWARLGELLQKESAPFIAAADAPEEGVTIVVTFHNPPALQALRKVLRGAQPGAIAEWPPKHIPNATLRFVAGHAK